MNYEIRPVDRYEDFKACERLQAEAFGYSDLEIVPYQILHSFATSGGIVLGAFDDESGDASGAMIGCVMGYTGLLEDGTPYHRSQRMAITAAQRSRGVGEALKRAQADVARRYGLRLMCWTFDPLRSLNAHLNIHKLGCSVRRYIENAQAASSSPRNGGARIDRLWAEWRLGESTEHRVQNTEHRTQNSAPSIVLANEDGVPGMVDLATKAEAAVIQVPEDIDAVRARDAGLVQAWRDATRDTFNYYFARGYVVTDYVRGQGYVLTRAA
jgi:chorismate synthase